MRVLLLCGTPGIPLHGPSGSSAHLRGVARALVAAGHEVRVATPRHSDHRGAVDEPLGIPAVHAEPRRTLWEWMGHWRERGELWDGRRLVRAATSEFGIPDLIWERHSLFCDAGMRLSEQHGIPRIVELNAPLAVERERFETLHDPALATQMEQTLLQSATRVIAVSQWLHNWAIESQGCAPERVRHVPNGTEVRRLGARGPMRHRMGLQRELVIGFVGSCKPWHGLHHLPAILDALPEATALVVGTGPTAVPQHSRLLAPGYASPNQLPDYIAAMDVGLAPYALDAPPWFCPLKILDYLAQGVPTVATNIGDCKSLIDRLGRSMDTLDPFAWATAIREATERPRIPQIRDWHDVVAEALDGL